MFDLLIGGELAPLFVAQSPDLRERSSLKANQFFHFSRQHRRGAPSSTGFSLLFLEAGEFQAKSFFDRARLISAVVCRLGDNFGPHPVDVFLLLRCAPEIEVVVKVPCQPPELGWTD